MTAGVLYPPTGIITLGGFGSFVSGPVTGYKIEVSCYATNFNDSGNAAYLRPSLKVNGESYFPAVTPTLTIFPTGTALDDPSQLQTVSWGGAGATWYNESTGAPAAFSSVDLAGAQVVLLFESDPGGNDSPTPAYIDYVRIVPPVVAPSAAGTLTTSVRLAAAPTAVATVTAGLTTSIRLAAAPAAEATVTAGLTTSIRLAATPAAVATVTAGLTTSIRLAATPTAAATTFANLTVFKESGPVEVLSVSTVVAAGNIIQVGAGSIVSTSTAVIRWLPVGPAAEVWTPQADPSDIWTPQTVPTSGWSAAA